MESTVLLAARDMEASKKFYTELMGRKILMDLGANVAMDGLALQELNMWADFIGEAPDAIRFGGKEMELVFETQDLDAFREKLMTWPDIELVHDAREFPWGQRVIRFYDPDKHIIEVGEDMKTVVMRFLAQGLSVEEVARRSMMPPPYIEACKSELDTE